MRDSDNEGQHFAQQPANVSQLHAANVSNETSESQPEADQQCDHLDQQDEEAQRELIQIRGLPYESGLQKEEVESDGDKIYSVALGEGQTPMNMFTDDYFEEMSNPTKYPFGRGGINTHRERNITIRKYFNQRLLLMVLDYK